MRFLTEKSPPATNQHLEAPKFTSETNTSTRMLKAECPSVPNVSKNALLSSHNPLSDSVINLEDMIVDASILAVSLIISVIKFSFCDHSELAQLYDYS